MVRITRGNATLSLGGPAVKIFTGQDLLIGKLKKKNFALGEKFEFTPEIRSESFILHFKGGEIFYNDKMVAAFLRWNSEFFVKNKFDYAFSISQDVAVSSQLRQVLLAFGLAQHRIIIKTTLIIPI